MTIMGCSLCPVSYTHLDVYKRQDRRLARTQNVIKSSGQLINDAVSERGYGMYSRLRQYHLIGAIGGFLTVLTAIISLAVSASYYISTESGIMVNILNIASNGLLAACFFGAFSISRDSLIKIGSLIAGIGLGWNILIAILQICLLYTSDTRYRFPSTQSNHGNAQCQCQNAYTERFIAKLCPKPLSLSGAPRRLTGRRSRSAVVEMHLVFPCNCLLYTSRCV